MEERESWRRRLFIHLPYPHLLKHWDEVEREDFNLEICFFPEDLGLLREEEARRRLITDEWLKRSEEFWGRMATEVAECGARIALENIYEEEPEPLRLLLDRLPEEEVGLCFDTGHFNAFSRASLSQWINAFGKRIFELHLHDNHGASDEHLGIGRGTFPFDELFLLLKENASSPFLTIEGKDEEAIRQSLEFLSRKRQILP